MWKNTANIYHSFTQIAVCFVFLCASILECGVGWKIENKTPAHASKFFKLIPDEAESRITRFNRATCHPERQFPSSTLNSRSFQLDFNVHHLRALQIQIVWRIFVTSWKIIWKTSPGGRGWTIMTRGSATRLCADCQGFLGEGTICVIPYWWGGGRALVEKCRHNFPICSLPMPLGMQLFAANFMAAEEGGL